MSLVLAGLIVAGASGAVMVGRWLARRSGAEPKAEEASDGERAPAEEALEGFPCQLGDVVMRMTGEEAWLAGGVVLAEEVPVAVLFVAPEAGRSTVLYVRPTPRAALLWLEPLDPGAVLVGGEPPSSVEHGGVRYERARRLPLRPRRIGVGAPDVGDAVVVAEYEAITADRLVVLMGRETLAYRGVELEASTYEVVASGRATLD